MSESQRLQPEDGQAFINFLQRWGALPSGELCATCDVCGWVVGHMPSCPQHNAEVPRSYVVLRGAQAYRYYMPERLGEAAGYVERRGRD